MRRSAGVPRPHGVDPYASLVGRLLFPVWEGGLMRRTTLRHHRLLLRTEHASEKELRQLQLDKLRRLVLHASLHVPHYRDAFRAVGFEPGDLRSLADLARLPVLTREEAQRTVDSRTSTSAPLVRYRARTGGTLGSFLEFGYDEDTEAWRKAAQIRAWGWGGYHVGARTLYYVGANHGLHPSPGQALRTWVERLLKQERFVGCMVRDERRLEAAAKALQDFRPRVIVGYPSAIADLARFVSEHGLETGADIAVLCHGEKVFDGDRRAMEAALGSVFETYACRETFMVASECEAHDGLHIAMENVLVEVGADPGSTGGGNVLLTDLNNLGMPLIRYAVGDVASGIRTDRCACGRTLPRLGSVEGRAVETLRGPSGARISSTLFEQLLMNALGAHVKQFQIVQKKDDSIVLRLAPQGELPSRQVDGMLAECRDLLPGLAVRVEMVSALPPESTGKRRVVVVEG